MTDNFTDFLMIPSFGVKITTEFWKLLQQDVKSWLQRIGHVKVWRVEEKQGV